MATKDRRVIFARINRRQPQQDVLSMRAFAEDMRDLAASRLTRHRVKSTAERPGRTWSAADMTVDASGDFMTGTLGYSTQEQHVEFDNDAWSWIKGQPRDSDAATPSTVVPFAVDLRNHERWISFIPTPRLQASQFCSGLEMVLNEAVTALELIPEAWEVDLVTSRSRVDEWLNLHPRVYLLTRTVKFTNPGLDLDNDRAQMRALHANRKTEEFAAAYNGHFDINSEVFGNKLDGVETGDLELRMEARGGQGVKSVKFNSKESADQAFVDDFGADLQQGMETALAALRDYVTTAGRGKR